MQRHASLVLGQDELLDHMRRGGRTNRKSTLSGLALRTPGGPSAKNRAPTEFARPGGAPPVPEAAMPHLISDDVLAAGALLV
jgi:hypothetical protein